MATRYYVGEPAWMTPVGCVAESLPRPTSKAGDNARSERVLGNSLIGSIALFLVDPRLLVASTTRNQKCLGFMRAAGASDRGSPQPLTVGTERENHPQYSAA